MLPIKKPSRREMARLIKSKEVPEGLGFKLEVEVEVLEGSSSIDMYKMSDRYRQSFCTNVYYWYISIPLVHICTTGLGFRLEDSVLRVYHSAEPKCWS
jgi:hypothetical protein